MKKTANRQAPVPARNIAVVGVGNLLLSDEGVAIHAVRALRQMALPPNVKVFELGTRGLEILEAVKGFRKMVIVDAVRSGAPTGSIRRWQLGELLDPDAPRMISLHEMDLLTTLKIGLATASLPNEVVVIGIEPLDLSPALNYRRN